MNSTQHTGIISSPQYRSTFLARFKKALLVELKNAFLFLITLFVYITSSVYGLYLFLVEFNLMKSVFGILTSALVVYIVGMYLTLLPSSLVYVFVFFAIFSFWTKFLYPMLGVAVFFSFFIIFLI